MDRFRAPVPATLEGAMTVGTAAAHALWWAGLPFLDVMPRPERPENLPEGTLWIDRPRLSVEGAVWVPNVGYGAIHGERHAYFRAALEAATGGDRAAAVVIFCEADCWMSWNAARRAVHEYGYSRVFWYPEGTTGWLAAGLPSEEIPIFGE
jgi:PQQ-dependent catabolism-associated CXXCW motif protein